MHRSLHYVHSIYYLISVYNVVQRSLVYNFLTRPILIALLRLPRTPFTAVLFHDSHNPHCEPDIHFHSSPLSRPPPTPSICQVASRQVISKNCSLITITILPTSRYSSSPKLRYYIRGWRTL